MLKCSSISKCENARPSSPLDPLTLASMRDSGGLPHISSLHPASTFDALVLAPNARWFRFGSSTSSCPPSVWRSCRGHSALCVAQTVRGYSQRPSQQGSNVCAQTRVRQCSGSVLPSDSCHTTEGLQLADTDAVTQVGSLFAGVHARILPCSTATHNQRSTPVLPQCPRILIFLSVWYSFSRLNALPPK
jgi:hypothetical protein